MQITWDLAPREIQICLINTNQNYLRPATESAIYPQYQVLKTTVYNFEDEKQGRQVDGANFIIHLIYMYSSNRRIEVDVLFKVQSAFLYLSKGPFIKLGWPTQRIKHIITWVLAYNFNSAGKEDSKPQMKS
jgi:hypothetical protein